jgi:glycosyltransferase involved in cell wall biosynthesis
MIETIHIQSQIDNPYLRHERLGYLENINGLLWARRIFFFSMWKSKQKEGPISIDLQGFDALFTTCPLNIRPANGCTFVQTIHDLIPLEYAQTSDNVEVFAERLAACLPARRLYVSDSTQRKYNSASLKSLPIDTKTPFEPLEKVAIQPPSLKFPEWLFGDPKGDNSQDLPPIDYPPSCFLLREANANDQPRTRKLKPFSYLLFNSSVEPRKNLLFLVQSYIESNLSSQGISLCVTGKLKRDAYSAAVRELVKYEPSIILTGYINESTKHDLYLNTLLLLSPSLVEGFGIPVLDAACLGSPTLASDCASHRQIHGLYDFNRHILLCNTLNTSSWASAMKALAAAHSHLPSQASEERQRRLHRYNQIAPKVTKSFTEQICSLLTNQVQTPQKILQSRGLHQIPLRPEELIS